MSLFQERATNSLNNLRIIFDLDITQLNTQWVNIGAGVWYVNADAIYAEVDSSLLTGFTAQSLPAVGSVLVDSIQLTQAMTLLQCSDNEGTFYWDGSNLYIHITGGDSPYIHTINIGVVFGYADHAFAPVNSTIFYESRLSAVPSISKSRDPLFFGKIQYEGGQVTLNNADGHFDLIGEDNNAYGNQARVSMGFADLPIADYERLFTGFVETLDIEETQASISFKDKRKQLTKQIQYSCTNCNALETIEEILLDNYSIPYNDLYYNTTLWESAKAKVPNITIDMQETDDTISVIENICNSVFGLFQVDPNGKYAFRVVRPGDAASFEIPDVDILNMPRASYDPSEVITSTKVGYARDWTISGASGYTYLVDTSQEADIYAKYKTYNQRTFDTYLIDLAAAQSFSDVILANSGTVRPKIDLVVPIKYWDIDVGDFAEITINRPHSTWFGTRKCEVIGKSFNLDNHTINLTVRKYGNEIAYRVTTDGYYRITTDGYIRKVGS